MDVRTVLGIDYGLKRVGIAVGNTLTRNAEPLKVLTRPTDDATGDAAVIQAILVLTHEWQVNEIAVGVPRHPDGAPHEMTAHCLTFIDSLRSTLALSITEVDERYSSVATPQKSTRKANGKIRAVVQDDLAAAVILQQFLSNI